MDNLYLIWQLLQQSQLFAVVIVGVFSLCVGSFLNVVIHRTPLMMKREWRYESAEFWQHEPDLDELHKTALKDTVANDTPISLSFPPSRCPKCNHQIRWYENIPLASWLWLKGKCKGCQNPISIRYPFVELITALLSVLAILVLGVNAQGLLALPFIWFLVALTAIDFDTQFLPDRLVFPLGMIGLIANTQAVFVSPLSAMWGLLLGFLSLWGITALYALLFKKQAMGAGDFKLLAVLGVWLGAGMLPLIILLSSFIGAIIGIILLIIRRESRGFAFGPYLAMAGIVALLFGNDIMVWYLSQFVTP